MILSSKVFNPILSYGKKNPRHLQNNCVWQKKESNGFRITWGFAFGWPFPLKTYHKPVDQSAGLCWRYIHTVKQHRDKSIGYTEEWEVGLSWKEYVSVYQISMNPRGCTLFTVLMRGKHLKPHSFMCRSCFHQQSWSLF